MARRHSMKLIPALTLVIFSSAASASGFQLLEQSASGIGNAFAGAAATAENASTIYFNPAGMTQLKEREVSGGLSAIGPSFRFHDQGSNTGALNGTGNGGDAGGWEAVPNGYASWALNKDLYVGLGIGAPFGLKTEYENPWVGAAQSTRFMVKTININPSIAYRVNENLSLGFGLNWQRLNAEYKRQVAVDTIPLTAMTSTLKLKDDAWGWNAGALFSISPATRVGVSYRSAIKYNATGTIDVTGGTSGANQSGSSDAKASLKLPDTFSLAVSHQLEDKWRVLGDLTWTGWSSLPKVDILRASDTALYIPASHVGQPAGATAQTLDTDFRDTWRLSAGAEYQYNDDWKLKVGVAYDQTPVKRAATRLVSLPDNDRVWLSLGAQWKPSNTSTLDFGMSYIHVRDSKINNDQTAAATGSSLSRGTVTGEYSGNIWLFGAQYSMSF